MAYKGRNLILQMVEGGGWNTVMGLQNVTIAISNTVVDVTSTQSGGWRQILDDCGNQTITITGTGIFKGDSAQLAMERAAFSHALSSFRAVFFDADWSGGHDISGLFMVSKLEYAGAYNGADTYNVTLESSGQMSGF